MQTRSTTFTDQLDLPAKSLSEIAWIITADWTHPNFAAVPYTNAMIDLRDMDDTYGADSARDIVLYFLANAGTWRGPVAREVKAELNRRLKGEAK